ncbi:hypothetical protein PILCRDRAFT_827415 [Piloderma croceum F 1598]|uniref:Uncharacterized protein n=1 Tax=Piloderma croceum (strain F 1598) TaxID=765440 RepID=A0A0C3BDE4_PILCF|nr:hypothetical protein PILCRDRAFT_827415 [Piloderma croceum F 1598]
MEVVALLQSKYIKSVAIVSYEVRRFMLQGIDSNKKSSQLGYAIAEHHRLTSSSASTYGLYISHDNISRSRNGTI